MEEIEGKEKVKVVWEDDGRTKRVYGYLLSETEIEREILPINRDGSLGTKPIVVGKRFTIAVTPTDYPEGVR